MELTKSKKIRSIGAADASTEVRNISGREVLVRLREPDGKLAKQVKSVMKELRQRARSPR